MSVVVIQDTQAFAANLPVRRRTVTALPLSTPTIDGVTPTMVAVGGTLTITGSNFLGSTVTDTLVSFDNAPGVAASTVQAGCVRVALPTTLQAGTRTLRVVRNVTFPLTPTPHPGFSSSPVPFQLLPSIQNTAPIQAPAGSSFTLQVSPAVGSGQAATLYIGDNAIPIDERPPTPATSTTLTFPIPGSFTPGAYPVRVEIDGAQSKLTLDTTTGSPTFGEYLPQIQVTP